MFMYFNGLKIAILKFSIELEYRTYITDSRWISPLIARLFYAVIDDNKMYINDTNHHY